MNDAAQRTAIDRITAALKMLDPEDSANVVGLLIRSSLTSYLDAGDLAVALAAILDLAGVIVLTVTLDAKIRVESTTHEDVIDPVRETIKTVHAAIDELILKNPEVVVQEGPAT